MKLSTVLLSTLLVVFVSAPVQASTEGILIVGSQSEVNEILRGAKLQATFSEQSDAMVAVSLTNNKMSVYENESAREIVAFVGHVPVGGMVVTFDCCGKLKELLEKLFCKVHHIGEHAMKAACWVLTHAKCLVVNGVTWVVHTGVDILKAIADILHCAFHCP